ncbi:MAG: hypothetical protein V1784_00985 [bacterium]
MRGARIWAIIPALIVFACAARAAFESEVCGPRAAGLGAAGVALGGDAWCAGRNPALLAGEQTGVGLAWQRLFDLPELSRLHLAGGFVLPDFSAAMEIHQFGGELYSETAAAASLARSFSSLVSVGGRISLNQVAIRGYGDGAALGASLGLCVRPIPELCAAACWRNFPQSRFARWNARMSEALQLGVALRLPRGSFVADVVEEPRFPAEYRFGAEAPILPPLTLRVGARLEPVRPSVGFTLHVSRWRFHYAGDLHPDLGPSHEFGLEASWR